MTTDAEGLTDGPARSNVTEFFRRFARTASDRLGSTWSFMAALLVVMVWAITGPLFQYSDTWQLVINTGTTIVTFLMVFLIQNAQNRDAVAIHLKLDELIRALDQARNGMVDLENRSDEEISEVRAEFADISHGRSGARDDSVRPITSATEARAGANNFPTAADVGKVRATH
jgi:low affinity Fe/Cu permease